MVHFSYDELLHLVSFAKEYLIERTLFESGASFATRVFDVPAKSVQPIISNYLSFPDLQLLVPAPQPPVTL